LIDAQSPTGVSSWFIRPTKRPAARALLFCFPRSGGGASSFRNWAEACDPNIEVILIQPPGRESRLREAPLTSMQSLATAVADALPAYLDRPFAFYGHSLGGKTSFETARELRRRGLPSPVHLYAAACSAPSVPWRHPSLHELPTDDLLREVQRRYGGVPQQIAADPELCALLVPALRADIAVIETYRYSEEAPLATPITCFCGAQDAMTPEPEAIEWRRHTSAAFRFEMFPGDHFFPTASRKPILDVIASDLGFGPLDSAPAIASKKDLEVGAFRS
jgi:medium-chain acyl-[acyl-carrier-protein] hydrolase